MGSRSLHRIRRTGSYRCCDPAWQLRAQPGGYRIGQGIDGEERRLDDLAIVGARGVERQSGDDVDAVAGAVQPLFDQIEPRRPFQPATGFLQQFPPRRRHRIFPALHPAARWHPLARAIGVADKQDTRRAVQGQDPASAEARLA